VGAAIANAIVALSLGIMVRVTVYRLTKTPFNPRILRHFVAGALSAMVLLALAQLVSPEGLVHLMLFSILEIEVFLAFLILLGELTWGDFNYFLDVMNPKAMVSYMKDEMSSKK
jgi:Kef-type K+ transport system membrane component KefB